MSQDADAVQIVLYMEYSLAPGARPDRIEHHVQGLTEAEVDLADAMGLARVLLFPAGHGTAVALVLGRRIEAALVGYRPARASTTYLSLLERLRALVRECYEHPRDSVMARTVGAK